MAEKNLALLANKLINQMEEEHLSKPEIDTVAILIFCRPDAQVNPALLQEKLAIREEV